MTANQPDSVNGTPEVRARAAEMQEKMMALVADRLKWDKVKPAFIKMYAETFTASEIDGILGFYKSSAGQASMSDDMKKPQENKQ